VRFRITNLADHVPVVIPLFHRSNHHDVISRHECQYNLSCVIVTDAQRLSLSLITFCHAVVCGPRMKIIVDLLICCTSILMFRLFFFFWFFVSLFSLFLSPFLSLSFHIVKPLLFGPAASLICDNNPKIGTTTHKLHFNGSTRYDSNMTSNTTVTLWHAGLLGQRLSSLDELHCVALCFSDTVWCSVLQCRTTGLKHARVSMYY